MKRIAPSSAHDQPSPGDESGWDIVAGPVRLSGFRVGYSSGKFTVKIDGSITAGPLAFSLDGLGLEFSLDQSARKSAAGHSLKILPRLIGAGLDLRRPPSLMVAAGLVFLSAPRDGFAGTAKIELQNLLTVRALGIWERLADGTSSIFAYAELRNPNGLFAVPPIVFTNLAVGFGINSSVRHPTIDEVSSFPLLGQTSSTAPPLTPSEALDRLTGLHGGVAWVRASAGQYWGAGGVVFTAFKFIETAAVIVVEGGTGNGSWKALLAGRTILDLPRPREKTTLAKVAIDFAIAYDSSLERFSLDVQVAAGSYVIDTNAQLSGGMALWVWGKDTPAQQRGFVLTLGGYHPLFNVPAHFPKPPRLGYRWRVGPVSITGNAYAALTDNALMVGGTFDAQFDSGGSLRLQAWLIATLDALVQWKPFYYDVDIGVRVGVAATVKVLFVKVRVSLEVGVRLSLYGPPLGGRAQVKVWFVTFTFPIGANKQAVPQIPWDDFALQIPAPLQIVLQSGMLVDIDPTESAAILSTHAVTPVTADTFMVAVTTAIPTGTITVNRVQQGQNLGNVPIRPMRRPSVSTKLDVTIVRGSTQIALKGWTFTQEQRGVPNALWGDLDKGDVNDPRLRTDRYTYLGIRAPAPELGASLPEISTAVLRTTDLPAAKLPPLSRPASGPVPREDAGSPKKIHDTLTQASNTIRNSRSALRDTLLEAGFELPGNSSLLKYAWAALNYYVKAPMLSDAN